MQLFHFIFQHFNKAGSIYRTQYFIRNFHIQQWRLLRLSCCASQFHNLSHNACITNDTHNPYQRLYYQLVYQLILYMTHINNFSYLS